jgi:hypothetical protein
VTPLRPDYNSESAGPGGVAAKRFPHDSFEECIAAECGTCAPNPPAAPVRYWIKRSWTRLWWRAINPDETLALMDTHTNYRAWTRERLLAKLRRMHEPQDEPWEEVEIVG